MALILNINNNYYKNVFAHKFYVLSIQMRMRNKISRGSINEYTYENGVNFEIKSFPSLRLSSFIVSEDIISILVDQNFTMNATGMVLELL